MEKILPILSSLLVELPVTLVLLVGIVLSLVHWRRHPAVSVMSLIAFLGFIIVNIINTSLNIWIPLSFQERDLSSSQIGIFFAVKNIITSFVIALLWILVMISIFIRRKKQEPLAR